MNAAVERTSNRIVFVIHGRNHLARDAVVNFLELLGLEPRTYGHKSLSSAKGTPYVHDLVMQGLTEATAIVALFTPEERVVLDADLRTESEKGQGGGRWRSRSNVIYETGLAIGIDKKAKKTIILNFGADVSDFSDVHGRDVIDMTHAEGPRLLRGRLRELIAFSFGNDEEWTHFKGFDSFMQGLERTEAARFRQFFGTSGSGYVRLVHATRAPREKEGRPPKFSEIFKTAEIKKIELDAEPEGVNHWFPIQDIRAAVTLSNKIARYGRDVKFVLDSAMTADADDGCAISLGLGFNAYTHELASRCRHELFTIGWGPSLHGHLTMTDQILLGKNKELLDTLIEHIGGRKKNDHEDYAIVARIVSRNRDRVDFVCAGRTADGTAAAGSYLARCWQEMHQMYTPAQARMENSNSEAKDIKTDSLVVVLRHTTGGQAHDTSAVELPELRGWWADQ